MPIELPEDHVMENDTLYPAHNEKTIDRVSGFLSKVVNSVRIYNIPVINYVIIVILGFFLNKLTTKYTDLYMKNSLITIIVSNLVLYGISDTLAQSLGCFAPQPVFSFNWRNSDNVALDEENINLDTYGDDSSMDQFIDYLDNESIIESIHSNNSLPMNMDFQNVVHRANNSTKIFRFGRLAGFMCWGFIMAFVQCWWYNFLNIYSKDPKFITVLEKVLTDQLCFSPVSLCCFFCYGTLVLENKTFNDYKQKLSKIYFKTLLINYSVWVPVQFVNFLLVPRDYQVPFSSSISVLWNCFLSIRNSSA